MKDYDTRLLKEYEELNIRINSLEKMLDKYANKTLEFNPNCSLELLLNQLQVMKSYLAILRVRVIKEIGYTYIQE